MIAGVQVKAARALLGLSLTQFGEEAGISPSTISRFENGGVAMSDTIMTIRKVLESKEITFVGDRATGEMGVVLRQKLTKPSRSRR